MEKEKVIYTDGHDVTVTDSTLHVKKNHYHLNGVTNFGLKTVRPMREPGILLLIVGVLILVAGFLNLISYVAPAVQFEDQTINANTLAIWIGAVLTLIGLLIIALSRERYSVRIVTAEGEKDAVVSRKKEYVLQVIDALNEAFGSDRTRNDSKYLSPS